MRPLRSLLPGVAAFGAVLTPARPQAPCVVSVPAQPPAVPFPTGCFVNAGDTVTITTDPLGCWHFCPCCPAGPNGNFPSAPVCCPGNPPCGSAGAVYQVNPAVVLPQVVFGALIGSVGNPQSVPGGPWVPGPGAWLLDDGLDVNPCTGLTGAAHGVPGGFGPGFVGSSLQAVVPVSGQIFLSMNDDPCCPDNSLALTVSIAVTPGPAPNDVGIVCCPTPSATSVAQGEPLSLTYTACNPGPNSYAGLTIFIRFHYAPSPLSGPGSGCGEHWGATNSPTMAVSDVFPGDLLPGGGTVTRTMSLPSGWIPPGIHYLSAEVDVGWDPGQANNEKTSLQPVTILAPTGCGASPPSIAASGPPVLGGLFSVGLSNLSGSPALLIGFPGLIPLCPLQGGCSLGMSTILASLPVTTWSVPVPNQVALVGASVSLQGVDFGANSGGCQPPTWAAPYDVSHTLVAKVR